MFLSRFLVGLTNSRQIVALNLQDAVVRRVEIYYVPRPSDKARYVLVLLVRNLVWSRFPFL